MKRLAAALVAAACGWQAWGGTGNCEFVDCVSLYSVPGAPQVDYARTLVRFSVPAEMRGKVADAATLHLYNSPGVPTATTPSVRTTTASWATSDSVATLNGLAVSDEIDTASFPGSNQVGWVTADVTGDAESGMVEALASETETVTFVLVRAGAASPDSKDTDSGYVGGPDLASVHEFTVTGANECYVSVTYSDGSLLTDSGALGMFFCQRGDWRQRAVGQHELLGVFGPELLDLVRDVGFLSGARLHERLHAEAGRIAQPDLLECYVWIVRGFRRSSPICSPPRDRHHRGERAYEERRFAQSLKRLAHCHHPPGDHYSTARAERAA